MTLSSRQWSRVLSEVSPPTFGEVAQVLTESDIIESEPATLLEEAISEGTLVEIDDGSYGRLQLAAETDVPTEGGECSKTSIENSGDVASVGQFQVEDGVFPETLRDADQWLTWKSTNDGRKVPRAPWESGGDEFVSAQDPDVWTDFETATIWSEKLPGYELAFTIRDREEYPEETFLLIDYDDVRDPGTGEIHPTVQEHVQRADSYADVSTSGTGIHIFCRASLPDGVKAIDAELPDAKGYPDAEIEVYDSARFSAMTGDHLAETPSEVTSCQEFVDELAEEFATVAEGTPEELLREPEKTKSELAAVETTTDIQDVFDAIQHTVPRDIRLRSSVTHERGDGSKSMDPSWTQSASGTRLAQVADGWVYRKGMHGLDALQVVALEERIITDESAYPTGEDFWDAVDALRERGAHIPEYEPADHEAVSALPLAKLASIDPSGRRRAAKKRGLEWPTTDEARERLRNRIFTAMRHSEDVVLDAPTALGKTTTVAMESWLDHANITDEQPVVHFSETREARDAAAETSRDSGCVSAVLKGRKERCPVATGAHDPETDDEDDPEVVVTIGGVPASAWFDDVCDGRGVPFSTAHTYLAEHHDQGHDDLPCCEGEAAECPAVAQWNGVPRNEEGTPTADIIHATHQFAHVPSLIRNCNVVFDERPDFAVGGEDGFSNDRIQRAVAAFLKEAGAPVRTWEGFVQLAQHDGFRGDAANERDATETRLDHTPSREWYLQEADAHTVAPALTRAIWYALGKDADTNGRRSATVTHHPPRLDGQVHENEGWNRLWVTVVVDEDNRVRTVRAAPDLSLARCVIGLDAHPAAPLWRRNTRPDISVETILTPEERRLWRRFERGLTVVQVGDATRPLASGEYFDEGGTRAVAEHLHETYGEEFRTAITAKSVEGRLRRILSDVGVPDPETMHYGEEKSRNDFGDEPVGFVNGCIDPGDDYVLDLLAEAGLDARPETSEGPDGEERRAHGREFVGDDAETAAAILASVRENHVAQAAGRYARNADDRHDTATVFVRTDALPVGFADLQVPGVEWVATDVQQGIITELRDRQQATAAELAEATGASKRHVAKTLARLSEAGNVSANEGAGAHGATVYSSDDAAASGVVDLGAAEITNGSVWGSYTWSFAIRSVPVSSSPSIPGEVASEATATGRHVGTQADLDAYNTG
jgi:hypothetical protein